MATGSKIDPFIVSNWNDFLEYNTPENVGKYVSFATPKIDFGVIYPHGFDEGLIIYPSVIGNDCHWYHLCVLPTTESTAAIEFKGEVEHLYIDAMYALNVQNIILPHSRLNKVYITCQTENGAVALNIFGETEGIVLENCECDIRASSHENISFNGSSLMELNNTLINLHLRSDNSVSFNSIVLSASKFTGKVKVGGNIDIQVSQKSPYVNTQSIWDVKTIGNAIRCLEQYGNDRCYYNIDKTTFTTSTQDWIGLTTLELADSSALAQVDFPIGGDSPWMLFDGDIINIAWINNDKLGAFTSIPRLYEVYVPMSLRSIGLYSFQINNIKSISLPDNCTYYNTSFKKGLRITGGILIE